MAKRKKIQKILAAFLLIVFALGVTPKLTMHTLFADHTDATGKASDNKTPQIYKAGINCQCDDLVAESNFIGASIPSIFILFRCHLFFNHPKVSFVSVSSLFIDMRGPPNKILNS